LKLDWNKIISNAVTVLVATVFVGAAVQLWNGVQTIDSRIDENLSEIRATQQVLAPKVDTIEARLLEILSHIDHGDEIVPFELPKKGALERIQEQRFSNQTSQQQIPNR